MSAELKPCPFCGSCDIKLVGHRNAGSGWHAGETVYSIDCMGCTASFANRYKREILVEQWNRRAQPAEEVQPVVKHTCAARHHTLAEPQDCDWPVCGCDPHATKVIEALQESGALYTHPPAADAETVRKALELAIENLEVANRCMDFGDVLPGLKAALAASKEKP